MLYTPIKGYDRPENAENADYIIKKYNSSVIIRFFHP